MKIQECNHCDHSQGTVHNTAGATTGYICCHCGRVRQEHVPPPDPTKWEREPADYGHGPHVPLQTATFGPKGY